MDNWLITILGNTPDVNFNTRFWSKVQIGLKNSCWEWKAFIHPKGYGQFQIKHGKPAHAHRVAYALSNKELKSDELVCHSCDNRRCCNPNHLFKGTPQSNMDDMIAKGRQKHPSLAGESCGKSKLSEQDVREIRKLFGAMSAQELGEKFGTHQDNIRCIVKRKTWKHIN